jgi:hypothetical protein
MTLFDLRNLSRSKTAFIIRSLARRSELSASDAVDDVIFLTVEGSCDIGESR